MKYYVDENVKNTQRKFPRQNRYNCLRYDMNENPEGLPKEFVDSVLKEITPEFLAIYPEPDKFLKRYADYIGVNVNNVLTTNGSDMAIRYLLETFGEKGKEVVTVSPSFEMYWVNCNILGLKHVPVEYEKDLTIDIRKILSAINDNTRIVVLLNPNNPVGNVYNEDEVRLVIEKAKQVGAVLIIDEAYHYFYEKTFLQLALKEENVIILRTFSKLMSLAACRLGVVISNPQLINYVRNIRLTFEVNSIALLFAEKLLEHPEIINYLITQEKQGKEYIIASLRQHGYWCRDCTGNFIFIKTKHDAQSVGKILEEKYNVLVHAYSNNLLKPYIRVSVGSVTAMETFLRYFYLVDENEESF